MLIVYFKVALILKQIDLSGKTIITHVLHIDQTLL